MCAIKKPKMPPAPVLPPEPAQMKQPDAAAIKSSQGRRTSDRVRSGSKTVVTGGSGVTDKADTEKKTLLGQ